MDYKLGLEVISLLMAIGAAVFAALKARAASRAAGAAERSAEAAERSYLLSERKLGLDLAVLRERWVENIGVALKNDGLKGTLALLPGLPAELRPVWLENTDLAAQFEKRESVQERKWPPMGDGPVRGFSRDLEE